MGLMSAKEESKEYIGVQLDDIFRLVAKCSWKEERGTNVLEKV